MRESMEEKIQNVIKWVSKYPLFYNSRVRNNPSEEYEKSHIEEGWTDDEYYLQQEKIRSDYDYLRTMHSGGKLTTEQIETLKNANVGGVFGYSTQTEEYAKKYGTSCDNVLYIIRKYGTFENFYDEFIKNANANDIDNDFDIASEIIKPVYNVDLADEKFNDNYDKFITKHGHPDLKYMMFYSSKALNNEIDNTLSSSRWREAFMSKFGLNDGIEKTYEEVNRTLLGVEIQKVGRIINRTIDKIEKNHTVFLFDGKNYFINNEFLSEEEQKEIYEADRTLRLSKIIDEETINASKVIKNYIDKIEKRKIEKEEQRKIEEDFIPYNEEVKEKVSIEEAEPSVRLYNCLTSSGINTLDDILSKNIKEIIKIPGMGKGSVAELIYIMKNYGYEINDNGEFINKNDLIKTENENINQTKEELQQEKTNLENAKKMMQGQEPQGQDPQGNTPIGGHRHP